VVVVRGGEACAKCRKGRQQAKVRGAQAKIAGQVQEAWAGAGKA